MSWELDAWKCVCRILLIAADHNLSPARFDNLIWNKWWDRIYSLSELMGKKYFCLFHNFPTSILQLCGVVVCSQSMVLKLVWHHKPTKVSLPYYGSSTKEVSTDKDA